MKRAAHYLAAEQLLEQAEADQDKARGSVATARANLHGDIRLYLRAAQIHAQLACAGPGVEQEVADLEKRTAPPQAERQAARRPLPTVLMAEQPATRPKPGPPHTAGKERS